MIIKFIRQNKGNNRGRSASVINYIVGKTKHKHESHSHEITKEKIDYICCSKNLGFTDPLWKEQDGKLHKISGKEAALSDIKLAFEQSESKNTRVEHPDEHIIVSLREGESLNDFQWEELANDLTNGLGFNDHNWVCFKHADSANEHIHLFLSCIFRLNRSVNSV
ncbi:MAG: relaxase/mobilization nuclease domain-containing protein [Candidatus Scalindua sp.]|nr:relaxase/mobilization nuclease domain-containing protein [Candidatus Scalindua sp.]